MFKHQGQDNDETLKFEALQTSLFNVPISCPASSGSPRLDTVAESTAECLDK